MSLEGSQRLHPVRKCSTTDRSGSGPGAASAVRVRSSPASASWLKPSAARRTMQPHSRHSIEERPPPDGGDEGHGTQLRGSVRAQPAAKGERRIQEGWHVALGNAWPRRDPRWRMAWRWSTRSRPRPGLLRSWSAVGGSGRDGAGARSAAVHGFDQPTCRVVTRIAARPGTWRRAGSLHRGLDVQRIGRGPDGTWAVATPSRRRSTGAARRQARRCPHLGRRRSRREGPLAPHPAERSEHLGPSASPARSPTGRVHADGDRPPTRLRSGLQRRARRARGAGRARNRAAGALPGRRAGASRPARRSSSAQNAAEAGARTNGQLWHALGLAAQCSASRRARASWLEQAVAKPIARRWRTGPASASRSTGP